ncbi:uncharacterized protein LOC109426674 isoform X2 [Aedes albopictus]|uniref:SAM domain-containing protein n=1 Tax=Aedes albopictus TaxID=7160 RepID=A0ABM1XQ83_AEDAL|nr:uncharacterized protein LOC109426674 isoform X2 [Aedes albopictus]
MDEFVENLLRKWNLVDLVDRFRDEEVNEEAFLLLTPEIIKELIPKLGRRAIFTARFNEFKESLQASEEPPVPVASASASPTPPVEPRALPPAPTDSFHATEDTKASLSVDNAKQFEKYFLEQLSPHPSVPSECVAVPTPAGPSTSEVDCDDEPSNKRIKLESLEVDDYGDSILLEDSSQDSESLMVETSYSMNKTMEDPLVPGVEKLRLLLQQSPFARYLLGLNELDKSNRTDLTNVVVQYMYSNQQCDGVRSHMFNYWADAIVSLFPSEIKENYFSAKEGCTSRLQARYSYLLRVRKNESSRQPGPSQSSSSRTVEENVLPDERSTFVHPGEQQIVEELRQIVSSCFVMRDTLHAKTLTPNQRNILTANIVNYLMDKNGGPISLQELELYAKAIEHIFPNENASIYFRRKGACSRVNGKLFDRYGYMKRKRSLAQGKAYSDFLDSNTPIGRLWEMKTVEEARALWNETYKARKEVSRKVVPAKLLEQFPFLAQPDGYTLFLDDFDQDHPHAIDTFKRHWPEFAASIYRYIEENNFLKGFTEFNTEGYQENILTSCLILLPLLFKLMVRNEKHWSPTRWDVCRNFVLYATDFKQAVHELKQRQELLNLWKLRINPVVVAIGPTIANIESCYIVIDQVFYRMETVPDAVETCVKMHTAMNLQYLDEVASPWMLVQRFVMKVELPKDNITTKVFGVLEILGRPLR